MRRAAVSIPSNMAEGKGHHSDHDFRRFLYHAGGSLLELEKQISLAHQLQYLSGENVDSLTQQTAVVGRALNAPVNSLENREKHAAAAVG